MSPEKITTEPSRPLFGDFLEYLRTQGFTVGVEHHLRLRLLLKRCGVECDPSDFKTLLCPLFATNAGQQEAFYRAFDAYFPFLQPTAPPSPPPPPPPPPYPRIRRWPYLGAATLAFLLLVAILSWESWQSKPRPKQAGETGQTAEDKTGQPPPDPGGAKSQAPKDAADKDHFHLLEHDVSANITRVPPFFSPRLAWFVDHRNALGWTASFGPAIFWLAYEAFLFRRRRLRIRRNRGKKPPYTWPIGSEPPKVPIYDPREIASVSRALHRRYQGGSERLDMDRTIAASVAALGFPAFRYSRESRLPEYLFLIDRSGVRDHQARLYENLAQALQQQGLLVSIYFYEADPRVCWDGAWEHSFHLEQLQAQFAGHRLLLFGDGAKLLDPVTGRLAKWHDLFSAWSDRALLTPEPPPQWGIRELFLASSFAIFPANVEGLSSLGSYLELRSSGSLTSSNRGESAEDSPSAGDDVSALRRHLGEDVFRWLCACAVYPELHWELTLRLGSLPSLPPGLVREENIVKLLRLECFRSGVMPEDLQRELLARIDPAVDREARQVIVALLENAPPPTGTFACDAHEFQIAYQLYRGNRGDDKTRRRLRHALEKLAPEELAQDYAHLDAAESVSRTRLDFLLPPGSRRALFPKGLPWLGPRNGVRVLGLVLAVAALLQALKAVDRKAQAAALQYRQVFERSLGLSISDARGDLQISWAPKALAVEHAVSGVLRIADGPSAQPYDLELTAAQLKAGIAKYQPASSTLAISLIVRDERANAAKEVVRIERPQPAGAPPVVPPIQTQAPIRIMGKVFYPPKRPASTSGTPIEFPDPPTIGGTQPIEPPAGILVSMGVLPKPPVQEPAATVSSTGTPMPRRFGGGEQPVALVLSPGGGRLLRANTKVPLSARAGDILFAGDGLRSESGAMTFLFCPANQVDTLSQSGEVHFDAKQANVKAGKIASQTAPVCLLPLIQRVVSASSQHYGVLLARGKPPFPSLPREKLPQDVLKELALVDAALARNAKDLAALVAAATIFERHNLLANAIEAYRNVADLWPDAVWAKFKIFEFEEWLAESAKAIQPTGKTYSLVIGISKYKSDRINALNYASNDAQTMYQFLQSPRGGGLPSTDLILLTDEKATTAAIRFGLQELFKRRATKNDTVILFIAAHGVVETPGSKQQAFVVTYDSDPEDLRGTALPMTDLQDLLDGRNVILYVDVCRSGAVGNVPNTNIVSQVERLGETPGSVFGLVSSSPREVSYEGPQFGGGHGAFSYFLLKGLDGYADEDKDGRVDGGELANYVRVQVAKATGNKQRPREFGNDLGNVTLSDLSKPGIQLQ